METIDKNITLYSHNQPDVFLSHFKEPYTIITVILSIAFALCTYRTITYFYNDDKKDGFISVIMNIIIAIGIYLIIQERPF